MKLSKVSSTLCALLFLGSPDISTTSAAASSVLSSNTVAASSTPDNRRTVIAGAKGHRRHLDQGHPPPGPRPKYVNPEGDWIYWKATALLSDPDDESKPPVPATAAQVGTATLISPDHVLLTLPNPLTADLNDIVSFKIEPGCKVGATKCGNLFSGIFNVAEEEPITFHPGPGLDPDGKPVEKAFALVNLAKSVPTKFDSFSTPTKFDFVGLLLRPGTIDSIVMAIIADGGVDKDWSRAILTEACHMTPGLALTDLCTNLKLDLLLTSTFGKGKGGKGKGAGADDAKPAETVKRSGKHSKSRAKMTIGLSKEMTLVDAKEKVPRAITDNAQNKLTEKQPKGDRRRLQRRRGQAANVQDSLFDFNVTSFEFLGECNREEQEGYSLEDSCFVATFDTNVISNQNCSNFESNAFSLALLQESVESIASEVDGVVGASIIGFGDELNTDAARTSQLQGALPVSEKSSSLVLVTTLIVVLTALAFIMIAVFVVIRKRRESSHYTPSDGERIAKDTPTFFSDFNWGGEGAGRGVETTMKDKEGVNVIKLSGASANSRVHGREEDSIIDDGSDGTESAGTRSRTSSVFRQYKFPSMVQM